MVYLFTTLKILRRSELAVPSVEVKLPTTGLCEGRVTRAVRRASTGLSRLGVRLSVPSA